MNMTELPLLKVCQFLRHSWKEAWRHRLQHNSVCAYGGCIAQLSVGAEAPVACVCIPILVTTFPKWLSETETLPHMYSFAGLIRRTPAQTFNDTAITDRRSDTTIFQLRAH